MGTKTVQLPTRFEKIDQLDGDSRFQKVKIYIAHTGENLNNSVFEESALINMTPSLAYVPILGYVSETEDGEDFAGHEKHIQIKDNELVVKFKTRAYGFVPENNNAHFEVSGGKEWLVAEGYLWTRFSDVMEIFDKANGSKGQSMEIGDATYYVDDMGRVVYQDGKFQGLCVLGENVPPAMTGSTISTVFSQTDVKSVVKEMLAEFSAEKGDDLVATKKKREDEVADETQEHAPEVKHEVTTAKVEPTPASPEAQEEKATVTETEDKGTAEPQTDHDDHESAESSSEMSVVKDDEDEEDDKDKKPDDSNSAKETEIKDKADKDKKLFKDDKEDSEDDEDQSEDDPETDDEDKKKDQFELRNSVRTAVSNMYSKGGQVSVQMVEMFDNHAVVAMETQDSRHLYDIQYSVDKKKRVVLGDKVEVVSSYKTLPEAEKEKKDRHKMCELEAQVAELSEYKNGIEMQAKQDSLDEAAGQLTSSQFEDIKKKFSNMSVEEVEKEIAFAVYTTHKAEFSGNSKVGVKVSNMTNKKENYGYGSANELFHN